MSHYIFLLILKYSAMYGVDPTLVSSVIEVESSYRTHVVGPKGEVGLMQLRPQYWPGKDLTDPATNIRLGTKHLAKALKACQSLGNAAVVCYNAGITGGKRLKYPHAHNYVKKVTGAMQHD